MQKFELMEEPGRTWAVVDTTLRSAAELAGKKLVGLTREDAELALFRLNVAIVRSTPKAAQNID